MSSGKAWETHYTRDRSFLLYPDENLVRMLKPHMERQGSAPVCALDAGCGTGRHVKLLAELGAHRVAAVDTSHTALMTCRSFYDSQFVQGNIARLPLKSSVFDLTVAWGSLHYSEKENLPAMLTEIRRVLKKGGRLFGTLRNSRDTFLRKGIHKGNDTWITSLKDLENSLVCFYNENELRDLLSLFSDASYGLMERSLIGDPASIISHWFFWAQK